MLVEGEKVECLWSGIKKGPPCKLKFPEPEVVVSALEKALKTEYTYLMKEWVFVGQKVKPLGLNFGIVSYKRSATCARKFEVTQAELRPTRRLVPEQATYKAETEEETVVMEGKRGKREEGDTETASEGQRVVIEHCKS
ncbi:hypothetical protein J4Q44_G00304670 [Coregonus suidteri]|uniref:Uncharacterized protein n=1 Tax=Coregonus suidteri TaxID=861788 RepID=A0AAN8QRB6_9TELE